MLPPKHTRRIGKILKSTLARRGRGSALPGLVVEKLDPDFLKRTLAGLPWGVVVVSGTNGKTTTTKMVVQLLRASGLKVFTNPTGSNFTRGIVASLLSAIDDGGNLDDDIAILELDEAHAVHFVIVSYSMSSATSSIASEKLTIRQNFSRKLSPLPPKA